MSGPDARSPAVDQAVLSAIVASSDDAIIGETAEGVIETWNAGAEKMYGYSAREAVGKSIALIAPPDRRTELARLLERIRRGEAVDHFETERVRKDGRRLRVSVSLSPIRNETGRIIGISTISRDITHRRQAELAAQKLQDQRREARKMEAVAALAGGMAHDFSNLLGAIIGNAELLELGLPSDSPLVDDVAELLDAARRASGLVEKLMTLSRRNEGRKVPLALHFLVRETAEKLTAADFPGVDIRVRLKEDAGRIWGDPKLVREMLSNLFANACQAVKEGGRVDIALAGATLDEGAVFDDLTPGRYVRLSVRDDGGGMAPETLERIFDPYFSTGRARMGAGLGLAVVHGVVKNHGGAVRAESAPGKGAAFEVFFPAYVDPDERAAGDVVRLALGSERIFMAYRDLSLVSGNKLLSRLGYDISACGGRTEGLRIFQSHPERFDLAILDMSLHIRADDALFQCILETRPDLPVILCAGAHEREAAETLLRAVSGMTTSRPVKIRRLANAVRTLLDERRGAFFGDG